MAWKLAGAGRPTTTAPPNRRAAAPTGRWNTPPHTPDSKSSCAHPAAPQLDAPAVIVSWPVPTATTAPAVTGAASTQPTVTRSPGRTSPNACCWPRRVSNGPRTNPNASPQPSTSPSPKPGTKPPPPQNNAATNEPDTPHPPTPKLNNRPILHAKRPCGTETSPPHQREASLHNPSQTPATPPKCQQVSETDRRCMTTVIRRARPGDAAEITAMIYNWQRSSVPSTTAPSPRARCTQRFWVEPDGVRPCRRGRRTDRGRCRLVYQLLHLGRASGHLSGGSVRPACISPPRAGPGPDA